MSLCCKRAAASRRGSMVSCTDGSEGTSQVSRLSGDVNLPGSLPCGTFSILVFMIANFPVVVKKVLGLEGESEDEADETGRKNGRPAIQNAVQSRTGKSGRVTLEATIKLIQI